MKTIYLAGKVTGLPIHEVTMKFGSKQKQLEAKGYKVINPLELVSKHAQGWKTDWHTAMKICIKYLMDADCAYFMPCWINSEGGNFEHSLCDKLGIDKYYNLKSLPDINQENPPFFLDDML